MRRGRCRVIRFRYHRTRIFLAYLRELAADIRDVQERRFASEYSSLLDVARDRTRARIGLMRMRLLAIGYLIGLTTRERDVRELLASVMALGVERIPAK